MSKFMESKRNRWIFAAIMVTISAVLQAISIRMFIRPGHLLSSGFTGVSILVNEIGMLKGINIPVSLTYILLNIPVAVICSRAISLKFTVMSLLQVSLTSLLLKVVPYHVFFDDILLNAIFGGVLYGLGAVIALDGEASTGGTDFIALYVSNKIGKTIWGYVFAFNCVLLTIFGLLFGWEYAAYSIILQFVATKTLESFHHRFDQSTIQIIVKDPEPILNEYIKHYRHGMTVLEAKGGYSKEQYYMLNTVTSSYEVQPIVRMVMHIDPRAIINVYKTQHFYGLFYRKPMD